MNAVTLVWRVSCVSLTRAEASLARADAFS